MSQKFIFSEKVKFIMKNGNGMSVYQNNTPSQCDTTQISWEAVIIPPEPVENNPIAQFAKSKGLSASSIMETISPCSYQNCSKEAVITVEGIVLCAEHAQILIDNLLNNPQN